MHILVTGAAGFIGFHVSKALLKQGHTVVGLDNLNAYYSPELKKDRLKILQEHDRFSFSLTDLADTASISALFASEKFTHVVHLAAQAGVRYSITNPHSYVQSNLVGFANILEGCRHAKIAHLVYASSSSVYGMNTHMPFSTKDNVDHPISLYAATKKSNELMAHTYSHLYNLPTTGLRFFTVYGPWGRPDMALFIFTKAILNDDPIPVFNNGQMQRDFTYVDDITEGVVRLLPTIPQVDSNFDFTAPAPDSSPAPYRVYNIGNNKPTPLLDFIKHIENALGKKAKLNMLPMQDGDVSATYADITDLQKAVAFAPDTDLGYGVQEFVNWYKEYYR